MARGCELVETTSSAPSPVILTGGGGRPNVVPELLSNVLNRPVTRQELRSASAAGAAVLAAQGVDESTLTPQQPPSTPYEPTPSAALAASAYLHWLEQVARTSGGRRP